MAAEAPCAYGELISIGAIGGEKNKAISAAIAAVLQQKLNVDPSRFYLKVSSNSSSSSVALLGMRYVQAASIKNQLLVCMDCQCRCCGVVQLPGASAPCRQQFTIAASANAAGSRNFVCCGCGLLEAGTCSELNSTAVALRALLLLTYGHICCASCPLLLLLRRAVCGCGPQRLWLEWVDLLSVWQICSGQGIAHTAQCDPSDAISHDG